MSAIPVSVGCLLIGYLYYGFERFRKIRRTFYIMIICDRYKHLFNIMLTFFTPVLTEKLLGLNITSRDENSKFTLPPPIITHTDATPMATPQGSPNERNDSDLTFGKGSDINSLTVEVPAVRKFR